MNIAPPVDLAHRPADILRSLSGSTNHPWDDPDPEPGLVVQDLSVRFRGRSLDVAAVRGVSFAVPRARTLVLLGESGSGKSVSARSILRLYGPNAEVRGRVSLGGVDLLALTETQMRQVRGRQLAFVPQDSSGALDPLRRIGSQITEILRCHGVARSRQEATARALELLGTVGIADPRRAVGSFPHELSGGMRQRALIAMGIACEPDVLIADEPTTALDVTIQAQILDLFGRLQSELGMGLLLVTHDVGVARQVADRVAVMYAGRLVEEGDGSIILDDPVHPYTRGLLGAVPSPDVPPGELRAIAGLPPAPGEARGPGCPFAPRCPDAVDDCRRHEPALTDVGARRRSACLLTGSPRPEPLSIEVGS
jgi:oligopeptide/dipeptide ABC transporter ATP-binding protein